ncbi:ankyrin repeat-containing domain protein [Aspergillus crustosus]
MGTPLTYAASEGDGEMVEILLKHGANIESRDNLGRSSLAIAADSITRVSPSSCYKQLLQAGADPEAANRQGKTPIWHAAVQNAQGALNVFLTRDGIDPQTATHRASELIAPVAQAGGISVLQVLRGYGADLNYKNSAGETAISASLSTSHTSMPAFQYLLREGVDVNVQDKNGFTPLHQAVHMHNPRAIKLLLEHPRTDISIKDNRGDTPFDLAMRGINPSRTEDYDEVDRREMLLLLLNHGVTEPESGVLQELLLIAVQEACKDVFEALLKHWRSHLQFTDDVVVRVLEKYPHMQDH